MQQKRNEKKCKEQSFTIRKKSVLDKREGEGEEERSRRKGEVEEQLTHEPDDKIKELVKETTMMSA